MLEAFRILEEDKGIKKEDIIDAVVESLLTLTKKQVTLQFILFVK